MSEILTIDQIRQFLLFHQKRLGVDSQIPSISEMSQKAGISRQTLYAILNNQRTEFGTRAQIRLSRAIEDLMNSENFGSTRVARIDLSEGIPRIRFGVRW